MPRPSPLQLGRRCTTTACEELEEASLDALSANFFFSLFQVVAHIDALRGTHNPSRSSCRRRGLALSKVESAAGGCPLRQ